MSLTPILLVAVLVAVDARLGLAAQLGTDGWSGPQVLAASVGPTVLIVLAAWAGIARCGVALRRRPGPGPIIAGARIAHWGRVLVVAQHAVAILGLGLLDRVRALTGNLVLVDEVICLLPPVLGLAAIWWAHDPLERRQREAMLVRRLDEGAAVYPMPGRGEHVMIHVRAGLLLLLVPLLLIVAAGETIDAVVPIEPLWLPAVAKIAATLLVFAVAPLLARMLLHVEPLPAGEVRDDLVAICERHHVSVREILLWNTGGTIINAAVMGLVGPLRFVLLTDALLESMTADQVRAVMAHEVAHVRRRHMPWLLVCLLACLSLTLLAIETPRVAASAAGWLPAAWPTWLELALVAVEIGTALLLFGWISRRFERQADTFAAQHLSTVDGGETVTEDAVASMRNALGRIARLHTMDPRKPSWRHGSIAWRQAYLSGLVDRPVKAVPIDRLVRRIKLVAGVVLIGSLPLHVGLVMLDTPPDQPVAGETE